MRGTIKTIDPNQLNGLKVENVVLKPYGVNINFEGKHILDIDDYWEYFDSDGKCIDRALGQENRKEFLLDRIIEQTIKEITVERNKVILIFENQTGLALHFSNPEHISLKRYKPFGDNNAGPIMPYWTGL